MWKKGRKKRTEGGREKEGLGNEPLKSTVVGKLAEHTEKANFAMLLSEILADNHAVRISYTFFFFKLIYFSYLNKRSKHTNLWLFKSISNGLITSLMNSFNRPMQIIIISSF